MLISPVEAAESFPDVALQCIEFYIVDYLFHFISPSSFSSIITNPASLCLN
jgi:hypothetical protein